MAPHEQDADRIGRRTPAQGVVLSSDMPLMLFCTVCADSHGTTWIAQELVQRALHDIWQDKASAWLVGDYVLMPDHLHFMCCPRRVSEGVSVERWTAYWKHVLSRRLQQSGWRWQRVLFHTRMRSDAHLQEKVDYIRDNPVAAGLVKRPEEWQWRGTVHDLAAHNRTFGGQPSRSGDG